MPNSRLGLEIRKGAEKVRMVNSFSWKMKCFLGEKVCNLREELREAYKGRHDVFRP